ncbi:MAG: S-adenosylmethionine:tRNA ribosyltransferase-isomerase [Acidimicrobiales bacterium]|nr:MAG: S-adenosylmethionine:tRNA ribosyltransferase-isomerase [Acidimicrobiales bacterium]
MCAVRVELLDYELPPESVAKTPAEPRDSARLLVDRGPGKEVLHRRVRDLPDVLEAGDVLVVNTSRVRKARLRLRRDTGGSVEALLVDRGTDGWWRALVRPAGRLREGELLRGGRSGDLVVRVGGRWERGRLLKIEARGGTALTDSDSADAVEEILEGEGEVPLPPYLSDVEIPPDRYQTVFARNIGSVAAPTAGLHLTEMLLARLRDRGVSVCEVELHVGPGTFVPLRAAEVEDHRMEEERYRVPQETQEALRRARRVVAVGTTVVRTLESFAQTGEPEGSTELFIYRGHRFRSVDLLLTNFHLPRSTPLAMVDAFVGDRWRDLYRVALQSGYRFLSLGDAMLAVGGTAVRARE